jgi:hypothetical protein
LPSRPTHTVVQLAAGQVKSSCCVPLMGSVKAIVVVPAATRTNKTNLPIMRVPLVRCRRLYFKLNVWRNCNRQAPPLTTTRGVAPLASTRMCLRGGDLADTNGWDQALVFLTALLTGFLAGVSAAFRMDLA